MHKDGMYVHACNMQDAAEKLEQDATEYEDCPGPMVEAAKKIASMWMKMAQHIRSEL